MKKYLSLLLIGSLQAGHLFGQPPITAEKTAYFRTIDVFVDSRTNPLAAYQLELSVKGGDAKIVGIEGGEHPAFKEAPFYDPKAIQQERVTVAAFNTAAADKLPTGKIRVATIHVRTVVGGLPEYALKLTAAATVGGEKIPAEASLRKNE